MHALVLGAGRMGRAAAWDLARQPGVELVRLVDRDPAPLVAAEHEVAALLLAGSHERRAKLETERSDLEDTLGLAALLEKFDVALSAADYRFNEPLTRAAIEAGTHLCDLGGNLFGETAVPLDEFVTAVRARGIDIRERWEDRA